MADKAKDFQATETTETTETFIEEVEVKRTRKSPASAASQSTSSTKKSEEYKVIVPLLNIREKASLVAEILGVLQEGDVVDIVARTPQGFGKLAEDEGYVKLEFLQKVTNG